MHTYEVVAEIESLLRTLQDAEMSQRAYLLTGNEEYLEPYLDTLRDTPAAHAATLLPSPRAMELEKDASKQITGLGPDVADAIASAPLHRPGVDIPPQPDGR